MTYFTLRQFWFLRVFLRKFLLRGFAFSYRCSTSRNSASIIDYQLNYKSTKVSARKIFV